MHQYNQPIIRESIHYDRRQHPQVFQMTMKVYQAIRNSIGRCPAERGGILGKDSTGVIRYFKYDKSNSCHATAYSPDTFYLNKVIKSWSTNGITFCGNIHSHPPGLIKPSLPDEFYASEILESFDDMEQLILPIVQTLPDTGGFQIHTHVAKPGQENNKRCKIEKANLQIIERYPTKKFMKPRLQANPYLQQQPSQTSLEFCANKESNNAKET